MAGDADGRWMVLDAASTGGSIVSFDTKAEALDYATYLRRLVRSGVPVDLTQAPA